MHHIHVMEQYLIGLEINNSLTCGNAEASCKSVIIPPYINYNLNNIYDNFNLTCGARRMCIDSK